MVETCDAGEGACGPALAVGLRRVVDENGLSRGRGGSDTEALRSLIAAVEPNDGPVWKQSPFDHTTAFGHGIHFPGWVGVIGLHTATTRVGRGCNVLVGTATADDDVSGPLVGA